MQDPQTFIDGSGEIKKISEADPLPTSAGAVSSAIGDPLDAAASDDPDDPATLISLQKRANELMSATGPVEVQESFDFTVINVASASTTLVHTGACVFGGIFVNTNGTTMTIEVHDALTATNQVILIPAPAAVGPVANLPKINLATGLTIKLNGTGTPNVTVLWKAV